MGHRYFCIDIGGTVTKHTLFDQGGKLLEDGHQPTPRDRASFLGLLDQLVGHLNDQVVGVGISTPGIVNLREETVTFTGTLKFMGTLNLAAYIRHASGRPVFIGNDANCATLAELWQGNLVGIDSGAMITLGTSVGGGLVLDGHLRLGRNFHAGQISAIGTNYGQTTKATTVGASTSAVKMIETIAKVCQLPDPTDGQAAFEKIMAGDERAQSIFTTFCQRVALLIISLQATLDLDRVLIGGGISKQPILLAEINRQFDCLVAQDPRLQSDILKPEILAAHFGNQANLRGALDGILMQLNHEIITK